MWVRAVMAERPSQDCVQSRRRGRIRKGVSPEERARAMTRLELLRQLSFGSQVAEDEVQELANYFVETYQWDQIASGKLDIIRGEKGAGKSAIYSLLSTKAEEFFDRGILLVAAENPRGTTVFRDLVADPPASEQEFLWLWKVYIITIIAQKFREYDIKGADAQKLYGMLEDAKLLPRDHDLSGMLRGALHFVRRLLKMGVEPGIEIDTTTGMPSAYVGRLTLGEPETDLKQMGFNSVDTLFKYANSALESHGYSLWVLLDRLDVAFSETHDLEANALRALMRVYGDLRAHDRISLKIFIREDIWKRIFQTGFREASHINNYAILDWSPEALLNLVIRRLLSNKILLEEFNIDRSYTLQDFGMQENLFYRLFPKQVEQGPQKSPTFKWMVSRCADATSRTAPRELIHLLKSIQQDEIKRLENGGSVGVDGQLFDRSVFKSALVPVSTARLHQYMYAEYPDMKALLEALEHEKTEQTTETLAKIWDVPNAEATKNAEKLKEIGFFERRGSRDKPTYWVPFLYRDALEMIQGRAESNEMTPEEE
jgi:hypothetical protein